MFISYFLEQQTETFAHQTDVLSLPFPVTLGRALGAVGAGLRRKMGHELLAVQMQEGCWALLFCVCVCVSQMLPN